MSFSPAAWSKASPVQGIPMGKRRWLLEYQRYLPRDVRAAPVRATAGGFLAPALAKFPLLVAACRDAIAAHGGERKRRPAPGGA